MKTYKKTYKSRKEVRDALSSAGFMYIGDGVWTPRGVYHLHHGEYSQPEYTIRRVRGGFAIHCRYYYYAGTINAPRSGFVDWIYQADE